MIYRHTKDNQVKKIIRHFMLQKKKKEKKYCLMEHLIAQVG